MSEIAYHARRMALLLCAVGAVQGAAAGDDAALRDPTRPSGWHATQDTAEGRRPLDALRLQGTFSVGGERSALLSGRRVTVGDRVAGAQVVGIDRDRVILRVDGETVELASATAPVKSPSNGEQEGR